MSILDRQQRPIVVFNPADVSHRKMYQQFLNTSSWAGCPVRFDLNHGHLELPHYINGLLVNWYTDRDAAMRK